MASWVSTFNQLFDSQRCSFKRYNLHLYIDLAQIHLVMCEHYYSVSKAPQSQGESTCALSLGNSKSN